MSIRASPLASDLTLFGRDATNGIVAVGPGPTDAAAAARVVVYRRQNDRTIEATEEPVHPFFFVSDISLLAQLPRDQFKFQKLNGHQYYRYLATFSSWAGYHRALRHIQANSEDPAAVYMIRSPAGQYLLQTGKTLFKDLSFNHIHRLQLDIEVASSRGFPRASRPADAIVVVSLSDNRGWRCLLHLAPALTVDNGLGLPDEATLLRELVRILRERNPDVIEGHNIFRFDLPYLQTRCRRHGIPFAIGRDGSVPRSYHTSIRFAERVIDFPALDVAGRHVVDTLFLVMSYDVFKRDLPGYGLKAAARYFGLAPEERTYVAGDDIARVWREDPARLLAYALDDVVETERLARHLSGSAFYLTQMLPMPYEQVVRSGPAAKIESLFVREHIRMKHALPRPEHGVQRNGGYTDIYLTGVVGPIVYADVESLYPSIMLQYNIRPASDELGLFTALLLRLTHLRFEAKSAMRAAAEPQIQSELDARQTSYKNLINSFYGYLGFNRALFNDYAEADRVTTTGRKLLRQMIELIRDRGGRVIEVDTDGVFFVPPGSVRDETAERAFLASISDAMPEGIQIGFDGRYRKMLSYKKKNYALLDYAGRLHFKGSSLVSRSTERFGRHFVREAIRLTLDGRVGELHAHYLATRDKILGHKWESPDDFSRTETLRQSLEPYDADVLAGRRSRAASYEVARIQMKRKGRQPSQGDRISYYMSGTAARVTSAKNARPVADWNRESPDENSSFYLKRLDELCQKFAPFFSDFHFRQLFSTEDMFGFSDAGIVLLTTECPPGDE